jgi:hypothetical protein
LIYFRFLHSNPSDDKGPQSLSVSVTGCTFSNSSVIFDSSRFADASFSPTGYAGGGAFFVRLFSSSIASSSFADNAAISRPFFNSKFEFNKVFSNGGALLLRANASLTGGEPLSVDIVSCNFTRNAASGTGSAMFVEDGCELSLSKSVISYNFALGGTLASSGVVKVSDSIFANNTVHYVASDIFISCGTDKCGAMFSSSTFVILEAAEFLTQKSEGTARTGTQLVTSDVCELAVLLVRANGFTPQVSSSSDVKIVDNRNAKQMCGKKDYLIAIVDNNMNSKFSIDFTCSNGFYPDRYSSIIASLSRVSLQQYQTALFQYPAFQSATELASFFAVNYICRTCPPETCQGITPLAYFANQIPDTGSTDFRTFCKPCPNGARCGDTSSLKVTPGLFLWSANNASNYNISSYAERLPPGFGASEEVK